MSLTNLFSKLKGGAGSGNLGHAGRIGHRGGSAPKMGSILSTGTRVGSKAEGEDFVKNSQIKETVYWATPYPDKVLAQGIIASGDEVNEVPGISVGRSRDVSEGYQRDTGRIFKVKILAKNPVEYGSQKVKGFDDADISDFYRKAQEQGFDAITGPGEIRVFNPSQVFILNES